MQVCDSETQLCKKCGKIKPLAQFPKREKSCKYGNGYKKECKDCFRIRHYTWMNTKLSEPEKREEYRARCREQHAQRMAVLRSNPVEYEKWRLKINHKNNKRRCRKLQISGSHTLEEWEDIGNIQPLCASCNASKSNRNCSSYRAV